MGMEKNMETNMYRYMYVCTYVSLFMYVYIKMIPYLCGLFFRQSGRTLHTGTDACFFRPAPVDVSWEGG